MRILDRLVGHLHRFDPLAGPVNRQQWSWAVACQESFDLRFRYPGSGVRSQLPIGESHFAMSNQSCHQPVGAEVFDTAPDPTTELPARSHDIMYLLTCKLPASRSATVPSVTRIGQTLPDIGTAVAHTEAISDRSLARLRSDRPGAVRGRF